MLVFFSGSGITFVLIFLTAIISGAALDKNPLFGYLIISIFVLVVNYIGCLVVFAVGIITKLKIARWSTLLLVYGITGYFIGVVFDYILNREISFFNIFLVLTVIVAVVFGIAPKIFKSEKQKIVISFAPIAIVLCLLIMNVVP